MEEAKVEIVRKVGDFEVKTDPGTKQVTVLYQGKPIKGEPVHTINGKKVIWVSEGAEMYLSSSPGCYMKWINGQLVKFCPPGVTC